MAATKSDAMQYQSRPSEEGGIIHLPPVPTVVPRLLHRVRSTPQLPLEWLRRPSTAKEKKTAVAEAEKAMFESTVDEFERLPPALRRKYFSNLERLRLAQKSVAPYSSDVCPSRKASTTTKRASSERRSTYVGRSNTRRLQKSESVRRDYFISQAEAQWFESLPKKIQSRQFTREEAVHILAGKKENNILDAADEALYRLGRQANRSKTSISTMSTSHRASRSSIPRTQQDPKEEEGSSEDLDPFRWLDDDEKLDLSLDDYHHHIRPTVPIASPTSPGPRSFRRTISLTSISRGRNSSSSKVPQTGALTSNPSTPTQSGPTSSVPPRSRHASRPSISAIDPSAKHYQDPESRLKLRVYLASPQKFDEAIEFGFPSLENRESFSQHRPDLRSRRTDSSARTFLDDDNGSLFDEDNDTGHMLKDDDDTSTIDETDSPLTPRDPAPRTSRSTRPGNSSESSGGPVRSRGRATRSGSYNQGGLLHQTPTAVSREMTLHMTLTRPDLRTAEDMEATRHMEDDPLRLADLPVTDGGNANIWDTMPADGGVMKKMWRKLRNR